MRIPKTVYSIKSTILFVAGLVLFTLFFAIIYTPNYGLSEEVISLSDMGEGEQDIMAKVPDISVKTVELVLHKMLKENKIKKIGTFIDARYMRNW